MWKLRTDPLRTAALCCAALLAMSHGQSLPLLPPERFKSYVDAFNADDQEIHPSTIPNAGAWDFLKANIPWFECPDKEFEKTWYFRWWTYRKHVKRVEPGGFHVITEFLPPVGWAGPHNTISCPAGHHFYEGRWLKTRKYLDEYAIFWFRRGGWPRQYSFWAADAVHALYLATGDAGPAKDLLPDLIRNYEGWEGDHRDPDGLFWQQDGYDGMEVSIGGSGKRATINSYMYGDAVAIARIAALAGREDIRRTYEAKAAALRSLVQTRLWDPAARFFKVLPRGSGASLAGVRELHGFTPWYFALPEPGKGYEAAWAQLMDTAGFYAPFGPTTAERRHPGFQVSYTGHECQWNGPSWPLATAVTLTALAKVLDRYPQAAVTKADFFRLLGIYAASHRRTLADGRTVPWIDENLNPFTGDWISRTRLSTWENGTWSAAKGGRERGKDYNHSTFNDLVITGLAGLRPRPDDTLEVNPLLPASAWDHFALDGVTYHGRGISILWDRDGRRYARGPGLSVFVDGMAVARSDSLARIRVPLDAPALTAARRVSRVSAPAATPGGYLASGRRAPARSKGTFPAVPTHR